MNGEPFAYFVQQVLQSKGLDMATHIIATNPDKSKHLETATTKIFGLEIDFVNLRTEVYNDTRNPTVCFGTPLEDAMRRDITINSLFYNLHTMQIEDWTQFGLSDLQNKIIRTPMSPLQTFKDDPLRVLRVIRFATRLNYQLVPEISLAAAKEEVQSAFLKKISRERVGVEIMKMLQGNDPYRSLDIIHSVGFSPLVFTPPSGIEGSFSTACSWIFNQIRQSQNNLTCLVRKHIGQIDDDMMFLACAISSFKALEFPQNGKLTPVTKYIVMNSLKVICVLN
jgi:tRNA nucleotidyltransferase (CCA-adding enzyme)